MVWSIDLDDFKGAFCGQGTYPLLKALNSALQPTTTTTSVSSICHRYDECNDFIIILVFSDNVSRSVQIYIFQECSDIFTFITTCDMHVARPVSLHAYTSTLEN